MPAAGPGTIPQREENMIRAGVQFLLAIGVFAAIVWGSMGLWDVATGSLGHTAEWRTILAFGFMSAGVTGLALIYNEILEEIHNEKG
jgi:hypothetical protein